MWILNFNGFIILKCQCFFDFSDEVANFDNLFGFYFPGMW